MNAKQASELVGDDRVMMNGRVGRVLRVEHNAVSICLLQLTMSVFLR